MGISLYGYSNVTTKNVPKDLRATIRKNATPPMRHLLDYLLWEGNTKIIVSKESEEWLKEISSDDKFIAIDWRNHVYFERTPETVEAEFHSSYSGFDALNRFVESKMPSSSLTFRVPDTDIEPWDGIIRGRDLSDALGDFSYAKLHSSPSELEEMSLDAVIKVYDVADTNGVLLIR